MANQPIKRSTVALLAVLFVIQTVCALFFVGELVTEVFGLRHWAIGWEIRELLQVAASLGLTVGAITGAILLRQTLRRIAVVDAHLRAAAGDFSRVLAEFFDAWGLTPSERDVAFFALRGFSNAEIAELRGKSEATIKTQMNAVFRKAGVTSRAQLLSQFVEVLLIGDAAPGSAAVGDRPALAAETA